MRVNRLWIVALALAFVAAAATAVIAAAVAHDRADELATLTETTNVQGVQLDQQTQQLAKQARQLDRLEHENATLTDDLAAATHLAARRAAELADLRSHLAGSCSASEATEPTLAGTLPTPVRETAQAILAEATTCDLTGLAALAVDDPELPFEYGLDATVPAAAYWADKEAQGDAPIAHLIQLFGLPVGTRTEPGFGHTFVWPSAASYRSWATVPPAEQEAVRAWYAAAGSAVPLYEGNYWGWRVIIDDAGNWRVFFKSPD